MPVLPNWEHPSTNAFTLSELAEEASYNLDLPKYKAVKTVKTAMRLIVEKAIEGKVVRIAGLGSFRLTEKAPKSFKNIKTGQFQTRAGYEALTFKMDASVKKRINAP